MKCQLLVLIIYLDFTWSITPAAHLYDFRKLSYDGPRWKDMDAVSSIMESSISLQKHPQNPELCLAYLLLDYRIRMTETMDRKTRTLVVTDDLMEKAKRHTLSNKSMSAYAAVFLKYSGNWNSSLRIAEEDIDADLAVSYSSANSEPIRHMLKFGAFLFIIASFAFLA